MRALSWNIDGTDHRRIGARIERLCVEIFLGGDLRSAMAGAALPAMPHVLAFQEVTRHAHSALRGHLRAAGFQMWPPQPLEDREDYLLLAVRPPYRLGRCEFRPFTVSALRRGCLVADLDGPRPCRFLTGHLESLRSGREARLAQAREVDGWLQEATPAVFGGDTNLRQGEWAVLRTGFRAQDAFHRVGEPRAHAATWWPRPGLPGYRFDRFWLTEEWRVASFRTRRALGASDHAGIEVDLGCRPEPRSSRGA